MFVPTSARDLLQRLITQVPAEFADFLAMHAEIRDNDIHTQLQYNFVEHL
jgi:hypothetical protein